MAFKEGLELIKTDNNRFVFSGGIKYMTSCTKSVEVDGEIYYKSQYVEKKENVDKLRVENPEMFGDRYIFCFDELDYTVTVEDFVTRDSLMEYDRYSFLEYSTQPDVNLVHNLFEKGMLDKRIKGIHTTKKPHYYRLYYNNEWHWILENLTVRIPLFGYGWNNWVCYEISLQTLFELEFEKIPQTIVEIFLAYGVRLNSKDKPKEFLKLLEMKIIKHETS